jgi:uncharacterized membrane protein YfcA
MISDPWFYAAALPIVFLVGVSKGGFLSGLGLLGVPLLSLVVSPTVAAGILLPVLIVMDMASVWAYRHAFDMSHLMVLLPGAVIGTVIGWLTAAWVTDAHIAIIAGTIGLGFLAQGLILGYRGIPHAVPGRLVGGGLGLAAGLTSFISHAGGPLVQIYLLPQRLPPVIFAGTIVMCFAATNLLKVGPFLALGLINVGIS